jgi:uncharacterized membrane protein
VTRTLTWDDYVHLAFDEVRLAGAGSPQVERRLRAALKDLLTVAPQERRGALQEQIDLMNAEAEEMGATRQQALSRRSERSRTG